VKFTITIEDAAGGGFRRNVKGEGNGADDDEGGDALRAATVAFAVLGILGHADIATPILDAIRAGQLEVDKRRAIAAGASLVTQPEPRRDH